MAVDFLDFFIGRGRGDVSYVAYVAYVTDVAYVSYVADVSYVSYVEEVGADATALHREGAALAMGACGRSCRAGSVAFVGGGEGG